MGCMMWQTYHRSKSFRGRYSVEEDLPIKCSSCIVISRLWLGRFPSLKYTVVRRPWVSIAIYACTDEISSGAQSLCHSLFHHCINSSLNVHFRWLLGKEIVSLHINIITYTTYRPSSMTYIRVSDCTHSLSIV